MGENPLHDAEPTLPAETELPAKPRAGPAPKATRKRTSIWDVARPADEDRPVLQETQGDEINYKIFGKFA